jgi:hypothetical protein
LAIADALIISFAAAPNAVLQSRLGYLRLAFAERRRARRRATGESHGNDGEKLQQSKHALDLIDIRFHGSSLLLNALSLLVNAHQARCLTLFRVVVRQAPMTARCTDAMSGRHCTLAAQSG